MKVNGWCKLINKKNCKWMERRKPNRYLGEQEKGGTNKHWKRKGPELEVSDELSEWAVLRPIWMQSRKSWERIKGRGAPETEACRRSLQAPPSRSPDVGISPGPLPAQRTVSPPQSCIFLFPNYLSIKYVWHTPSRLPGWPQSNINSGEEGTRDSARL